MKHFIENQLRQINVNSSLHWLNPNVATFTMEFNRATVDALFAQTRKNGPMWHSVQRKEKAKVQKERYTPAMNNGSWVDNASIICFVAYPDSKGNLCFKLADGYQRTASAYIKLNH